MKLLEIFDKGASSKWKTSHNGNDMKYQFFLNRKTGEIVDEPRGDGDYIEYDAVLMEISPNYSVTPDFQRRVETEMDGRFPWNVPKEARMNQFNLPENTYEFHFSNQNEKQLLDKSKITGTGHSIRVFGTVVEILKDAIKRSNAEYVLISSFTDDPSRPKLYDRLVGKQAIKKWEKNGVMYWLIKARN